MPPIKNDYRVRLIKDCRAINPEFNPLQEVGPQNPRFVTFKAGRELSGPHAWLLCRPDAYFDDVKAEPLDDFTRARVEREERRSAAILAAREKRLQAEAAMKAAKKRRNR